MKIKHLIIGLLSTLSISSAMAQDYPIDYLSPEFHAGRRAAFKEKMIQALDNCLKVPYTIVDHITGIRPANTERRPFVGTHPNYPSLAICNGMGTKGCSLAPYFSKQLIDYLDTIIYVKNLVNLVD